jgi:hypothetical protein
MEEKYLFGPKYYRKFALNKGATMSNEQLINKKRRTNMKKTLAFTVALATLVVLSPINKAYAKKATCNTALGGCNGQCEQIYSAENPGRYGCYAGCEIGWLFC